MSKEKHTDLQRFAIIKRYLRRYKRYLLTGGVAVIGANILLLINPYLLKKAFDALEHNAASVEILRIALMIVGLTVLSGVFRFIMRRSIIWMSRKIEYDLRIDLFTHLLKLGPSFYYTNKTGDIMARSTNDVEAVRAMLGPGIMHISSTIVSSIIAASFMIYLSPLLTLYSLIPLPFIAIAVNRLGQIVHRRFSRIQEYFSILTSKVQENLAGVRVVRAYNQENAEIADFSRHCKNYIRLNLRMIRITAFFFPLLFLFGGTVNLFVFYFGGKSVIGGTITLGTLVAFFAYLAMLIWPMIALGWVVSLYQRGTASLDRINRILSTQPDISAPDRGPARAEVKGKIEFRRLSFSYNGSEVLHGINLVVPPGTAVGIVGPTASGKSTLVALISRMFPVPRGMLFVDDIDINDWDPHTLRRNIGFVPQEPFLFSDTLLNNILFGSDHKEAAAARKAAETAAMEKEIEAFPLGYETVLGERGITLSGGQKQRVSIARALAADPRILILDDATSAVDTETEHLINLRMKSEIFKRTSIVISHRVSAVKNADIIVYMEHGAIAESGSHDQLMALGGRYARLYHAQLLEDELRRM